MKKLMLTFLCVAVSVPTWAAIEPPAANYTITTTDIEPTDSIGELNDDPEQTTLATATEKTTIDNDLVTRTSEKNKEWKSRKDSAHKRQKNDNMLKYN